MFGCVFSPGRSLPTHFAAGFYRHKPECGCPRPAAKYKVCLYGDKQRKFSP